MEDLRGDHLSVNLTTQGQYLNCLYYAIQGAKDKAASYVASRSRFTLGYDPRDDYDDYVVSYLGQALGYANSSTRTGSYANRDTKTTYTYYFDAQCKYVSNPNKTTACNAGDVQAYTSPISLLWENGADLEGDLVVTNFQLDPGVTGRSYVWKASAKTPLVVYDPKHRGEITSATQLFGDWTFGGKRAASLAGSTAEQWQNGFEALASLDRNGNGKIDGEELEPLALWFDGNRDGKSQPGEVKDIREAGVTSLSFKTDHQDELTGSIYITHGFERLVDGKTVEGSAVDWYGEGAGTSLDLVVKFVARNGELNNSTGENASTKNVSPSITAPNSTTGALSTSKSLNGMWLWNSENIPDENNRSAAGYLTFKDDGSGKISGHSYVAASLSPATSEVSSMLAIAAFTGSKVIDQSGNANVLFENESDDGGKITSKCILSADGNELKGATVVSLGSGSDAKTMKYSWVAKRIDGIALP